jgi:predicted MFS family arabinose efflux permease
VIRDRRAILALLTALNLVNYIDRAVIAAVLAPMKIELGLSNLEAGLLNTAFLIGYFTTCPLFGARADKAARKRLIALGVVIWSLATMASGVATGFWTLLAARVVVGVGEASFTVLAPTIIDDVTPHGDKGKALAVFFLATPIGYALGYILGGTISHHWGWRSAFYLVGGPGILFALACLWIAEPTRKLLDVRAKLVDGLREVVQLPLFRRAVLGYCAYTAAVAGFSYWVPSYLLERFHDLNGETANFWFGIVLIVAGAIGTVIGGRWLDRSLRGLPPIPLDTPHDAPENKAATNAALRICSIGVIAAAPLAVACFLVPSSTLFFAIVFLVEVGLFLATSPVNCAVLRSVPPERRASAMAAMIFSIHLLGDLWSSAALGVLLDALPLTIAMMALPLTFACAGYIWWPRRREAAGPSATASGVTRSGLPEARVHTTT